MCCLAPRYFSHRLHYYVSIRNSNKIGEKNVDEEDEGINGTPYCTCTGTPFAFLYSYYKLMVVSH